MFGIKSFASIVNQPEGMILSVGAGEKRPIVLADETLGVSTVISVTLSCDRVIGGAEGARWLSVQALCRNPRKHVALSHHIDG